jgi:MFS family permease
MAACSFSLSSGSQIGTMVAAFLIQARGWRWLFILCAILFGANFLSTVFFLPETLFRRAAHGYETAAELDKKAIEIVENAESKNLDRTPTNTQDDGIERAHYAGGYWKDLFQFKDRGLERGGIREWPRQLSLPFRFLFEISLGAVCTNDFLRRIVLISAVGPQLLSPPPYLFSSTQLGLYTMSSFIGIIVAMPIAGPFTDWISKEMRRRNDGIHLPEHRMPALIFPFVICPPGLILFAYMIHQGRSVYLSAIGYALQSSSLVFVPSVVMSYVVDAYPRTGSEGLVLINAGKNLVAFGVTLLSSKWLANEGLVNMMFELSGAQWGVLITAIPLYFASPWLHRQSLRFL